MISESVNRFNISSAQKRLYPDNEPESMYGNIGE